MKREDVIKLMSVLRGAYPQFYRDVDRQEALDTISLWADMFAEDDAATVAAAVKALIATDSKGYPPHIGAVKAKIRQITTPREMTEAEAWGLVLRAVSRGIYNAQDEFEKLPETVKHIVGSPNQIREWAMMDADTVGSVVASNFQRSYRARAAANREFAALPSDVKAIVGKIGTGLALECRHE